MDSVQKKHAAYSNTDTSKVTVSDSEWEKVLPQDVYYVARKKGTERRWSSPPQKVFDKGTSIAPSAVIHFFKAILNLKVVVGGQVFMNT